MMTKEQIEKTAVAIKESLNYHMSFEDAQDYISKCGFDIPWNDGDVFVDDREITRTIGNVLKWRINSVWHDGREVPEANKRVLVCFETDIDKIVYYRVRAFKPNVIKNWNTGHRVLDKILYWAYLDDLLPERKEESNG